MGALTDAQVYLASYRQAQIEKDDSVLTCMSVLSHQCQVMSELFIFWADFFQSSFLEMKVFSRHPLCLAVCQLGEVSI